MNTLLSTQIVWLRLDPCDEKEPHEQADCLPAALEGVFGRTLRIALAMRGGISLAVWIGGAVAELDVFRRIRLVRVGGMIRAYLAYTPGLDNQEDDEALYRRADVYARMLLARGYDTIEFDILAGASAGGLNGVLYAVAQRAGANVDSMLDVWLEAGDIWTLLRRHGVRGVDSVLRGDEYFWRQMQLELAGLYTKPGRNKGHVSRRVTLDLSATITDGVDVPDGDSQEGYGHFHFIGTDETTGGPHPTLLAGREIPRAATGGDDPNIVRLAYAARTTSAFPGAFEPALISSYAITDPAELQTDFTDLSFAFAAHRNQAAPAFHVVDGGVKDNIPIDRAFRSIRRSPLDDFASRTLLYLDPSAIAPASIVLPADGASAPRVRPISPFRAHFLRKDALSHFITATITSLKKFALRESGEQEIQAVEDFRRGLLAAEARSRVAAQSVRPLGSGFLAGDASAAQVSYVRARATADVIVLDDILQHPAQWQLGTNLTVRRLRIAANENVRKLVEQLVLGSYGRSTVVDDSLRLAVSRGPQALQDTVRSAAAWLRFLDEATFYDAPDARRYFAPSFDALREAVDAAGRAVRAARESIVDQMLTAAYPQQAAGNDEGAAAAIFARWTTLPPNVAPLWEQLAPIVCQLKSLTENLLYYPDAAAPIDGSIWSKVPLEPEFDVYDLAAYVAATGIPEPLSDLRFRSITSGEKPGDKLPLSDLVDTREINRARLALKKAIGATSRSDLLGAETKLGGIALHNFGGFLSREWRRRDWWWGRLDAAAGMLRFLDGLETVTAQATIVAERNGDPPCSQCCGCGDTESQVDAVQLNLWETAKRSHESAKESRDFATTIPSLGHLRADYLGAVASRLIRILSRALVREGTNARAGKHVAVWLIRPIAVLVPLAFNPQRALLAVSLVLAMVMGLLPRVERRGDAAFFLPVIGPWPAALLVGSLLVIIAAAWISALGTFVKVEARWRAVSPKIDGSTAIELARRMRTRSRWWFWGQFALASGVIAVLAVVSPRFEHLLLGFSFTHIEFWGLYVVVLILLGASARAASSLRGKARVDIGGVISVVASIGLIVAAELLFRSRRWPDRVDDKLPFESLVLIGCTAALVVAVLFYGWKAGVSPRRRASESRSSLVLRCLGAAGLWLLASAICGVVTFGAAWLTSFMQHPPAVVLAVAFTYFAWGTAAWWLGEIPTPYEPPDDLARARS